MLKLLYGPTFTSVHDYWEKTIALIIQTFVGKMMFLLFNMLSRFVIAFLPSSKCLWISWLQSPSTVILEAKKINSVSVSIFSSSICHEMVRSGECCFKPAFSLYSFTFIKMLLSSSSVLPLRWYHLHIWSYWYFSRHSSFQLVIHPG